MPFKNKICFIFSILIFSLLFSFVSCVGTTSSDSVVKQKEGDSLLLVHVSGLSRNLPPDFIGFNANLIKGPSWSDTSFLNVLKTFHPELIRFPGGTVANYWDWQKGWFRSDIDLPKDFSQRKPLNEPLEDFADAMKYIDAKPVFDLNVLTSDFNTQKLFLLKAQKLQLPVEYIEMGNEFYSGDQIYLQKFPDGNRYALLTNEWIDSLKRIFPEAKYAVVGNGTQDVGKVSFHRNRRNHWNDDLLASEKETDAITFHFYHDQMLKDPSLQNEIVYLRSQRKNNDSITSALSPDFSKPINEIFSDEQSLIDRSISEINQLPLSLPVWITESNTTDRDNSMRLNGTWLQGLYVANLFMQMIMQPRVRMLLFHQVSSTSNFAAIFNDTGAFSGFEKQVANKKFGISAAGYSMRFIMNAVHGMDSAIDLSFDSNAALRGILFSDKKNQTLLLLNLSDVAETIDLGSISSSLMNLSGWQIACSPLETITGFENNIEKNISSENKRIRLPQYSLTVLFSKS